MTYEEANNIIDDISWVYNGKMITEEMRNECRNLCHEALKKQIPKKPIKVKKHYECECGVWLLYDDEIPNENDSYCPRCGQALDWNDWSENDE